MSQLQARPEGANEYNIWYNKYFGENWKGNKDNGMFASVPSYLCIASTDVLETAFLFVW